MPPAQDRNPASDDIEPNQKSQSKWLKDSGYGNLWKLGLCYGKKIHDQEDLEETRAILKALRDMDQEDWEERQAEKK
ncbi:hypothetical protein BP00DRAFT_429560 [Aspergillus indologenus CBS 114.80]|uniref:Uncharacterized protein n=1 Tax=Aspergillus indologenus CBS 114.80 TaxID=1450541 RepID=A0A2V5HRV4_9EURO|nr:hypothetical protein BP00DRAFT_429560 [Aspergillus indologenus CBS 114.80]